MAGFSILLVDDDYFVLNGIGNYLAGKGYGVTTADSGEKAYELLDERAFHLVITDLVMEKIDGIGVLRKAKESNPDTMVMILTGYGSLHSAMEAIRFDADDYILKPCEPLNIGLRVFQCFEKYESALKIKARENLLPVCCVCKKVRDDAGREPGTGSWVAFENYLKDKAGMDVTSAYCPECFKEAEEELERLFHRIGGPGVL